MCRDVPFARTIKWSDTPDSYVLPEKWHRDVPKKNRSPKTPVRYQRMKPNLRFDEDALAGAFLGGFNRHVFLTFRHNREPIGPLRVT